MAVPITHHDQWVNTSEYLEIVPGIHFRDDYDPPSQPFAGRNSWETLYWSQADASRFTVEITDGALQIRNDAYPADLFGRVLMKPPGPALEVQDFNASVDILDWDASSLDFTIGIVVKPNSICNVS